MVRGRWRTNNGQPCSHEMKIMTEQQTAHIEPSRHSTDEVDEKLRQVEGNVDVSIGAGSPAIKPNTELDEDGKPINDIHNPQV